MDAAKKVLGESRENARNEYFTNQKVATTPENQETWNRCDTFWISFQGKRDRILPLWDVMRIWNPALSPASVSPSIIFHCHYPHLYHIIAYQLHCKWPIFSLTGALVAIVCHKCPVSQFLNFHSADQCKSPSKSINAIDVKRVTLSRLNTINAIHICLVGDIFGTLWDT